MRKAKPLDFGEDVDSADAANPVPDALHQVLNFIYDRSFDLHELLFTHSRGCAQQLQMQKAEAAYRELLPLSDSRGRVPQLDFMSTSWPEEARGVPMAGALLQRFLQRLPRPLFQSSLASAQSRWSRSVSVAAAQSSCSRSISVAAAQSSCSRSVSVAAAQSSCSRSISVAAAQSSCSRSISVAAAQESLALESEQRRHTIGHLVQVAAVVHRITGHSVAQVSRQLRQVLQDSLAAQAPPCFPQFLEFLVANADAVFTDAGGGVQYHRCADCAVARALGRDLHLTFVCEGRVLPAGLDKLLQFVRSCDCSAEAVLRHSVSSSSAAARRLWRSIDDDGTADVRSLLGHVGEAEAAAAALSAILLFLQQLPQPLLSSGALLASSDWRSPECDVSCARALRNQPLTHRQVMRSLCAMAKRMLERAGTSTAAVQTVEKCLTQAATQNRQLAT